jgi:3-oxoacyl-[acyl-carrier-protein] synthase III
MTPRVGILGVGAFLPPLERRNDWWPESTVAAWQQPVRPGDPPADATPAEARVIAALQRERADPFQGVEVRHVMASDMTATDMEVEAALAALARAGRRSEDVDLLLSHTAVPEVLMSNPACALHARLELPPSCPAWQLDASSYSFLAQLTLAESMVASSRASCVLLVQSCAASRLLDPSSALSVAFGDGATAVVVAEVPAPAGILASAHRTDGRWGRTLVASVPSGRWYDDGRAVLHVADPAAAREVFMSTVDRGKEVVDAVLASAGHAAEEVEFFGVHQGAQWLAQIARQGMGVTRAKMADVFPRTGHMFSASIPLTLHRGLADGAIKPGTLVLLFGGGTGMTYGASLMRWSGV